MARQQDQPDLLSLTHRWLVRYQQCINNNRVDMAKELFHSKAVSFGVFHDDARDAHAITDEWASWNTWRGFTFEMDDAAILPMNGGIVVACKWKAQSRLLDSIQKHGRATFLFCLFDNGVFKALHEHISESPC